MTAGERGVFRIRPRLPRLIKLMITAEFHQFNGAWPPQMLLQDNIHLQAGFQGKEQENKQ